MLKHLDELEVRAAFWKRSGFVSQQNVATRPPRSCPFPSVGLRGDSSHQATPLRCLLDEMTRDPAAGSQLFCFGPILIDSDPAELGCSDPVWLAPLSPVNLHQFLTAALYVLLLTSTWRTKPSSVAPCLLVPRAGCFKQDL